MMFCNRLSLLLCVALLGGMPGVSFGWVKFYESEHRIDARPEDTQVQVEYRFANKGAKAVKILSLDASCGCTTAKLEKDTYEPGERGRIKVTFDFGNRVGQQQKTITVKTDDPQTPVKVLKLSVSIPEIVRFGPKVMKWIPAPAPGSPGSPGSSKRSAGLRILKFSSKPDLNIKVTELDYDEAALQIKELPVEKENEQMWVVVPKDMSKAIETAIRIKTNYPTAAPKEYVIAVTVEARTSATPQPTKAKDTVKKDKKKPLSPMASWMRKVFTGSDELPLRLDRHMVMFSPSSVEQTQYVSGVVLADYPIEIQSVEIKGMDHCKAELVPLDMNGYFLIKLTLPPEALKAPEVAPTPEAPQPAKPEQPQKPMPQRGQILIHTNPPAPTPVPVYGFIHQPMFRQSSQVMQRTIKNKPAPQTQPAALNQSK